MRVSASPCVCRLLHVLYVSCVYKFVAVIYYTNMIYLNIGPVYINIFINISISAHSTTVRSHLHIYIYMSNLILFIYPFLEMGAYFCASTHCERKTFVYVNVNAMYVLYILTHLPIPSSW